MPPPDPQEILGSIDWNMDLPKADPGNAGVASVFDTYSRFFRTATRLCCGTYFLGGNDNDKHTQNHPYTL